MPRESKPAAPFPVTRWSWIDAVRSQDVAYRRNALEKLLKLYLPALRAYLLLGRRLSESQADDLLQGFIADKIVERDLISRADPRLGKFRNYLLTALKRYCIDRYRSDRHKPVVSDALMNDVADGSPPVSDAFDSAWTTQVLREAITRTEKKLDEWGRPDLWEVFRGRVLLPAIENAVPVEYASLLPRFGWKNATQAANALMTAKRMFERELRGVIREYAGEGSSIEEELADLRAVAARGAPCKAPLLD